VAVEYLLDTALDVIPEMVIDAMRAFPVYVDAGGI
jgi:hypothetical protein